MSESSKVIPLVRIWATRLGMRLLRNAVGMAWQGTVVNEKKTKDGLIVTIRSARFLPFGLLTPSLEGAKSRKKKNGGTSDLIGWTPTVITSEMVGSTMAVFTAVECKTDAYPTVTTDQGNFLDQVVAAGGLGYVGREAGKGIVVKKWPDK